MIVGMHYRLGFGFGRGHYIRSRVLKRELEARGHEVRFVRYGMPGVPEFWPVCDVMFRDVSNSCEEDFELSNPEVPIMAYDDRGYGKRSLGALTPETESPRFMNPLTRPDRPGPFEGFEWQMVPKTPAHAVDADHLAYLTKLFSGEIKSVHWGVDWQTVCAHDLPVRFKAAKNSDGKSELWRRIRWSRAFIKRHTRFDTHERLADMLETMAKRLPVTLFAQSNEQ